MSAGLDPPEVAPTAVTEIGPEELPAPRERRGPSAPALWARVALAISLLGASAVGRYWQSRRVDTILRDGRVAPFQLAELPLALGPWTGHDEPLDPLIARATGSTQSIQRVYQHGTTGQRVTVLVLFGPSSEMFVHAPEVCYPSAGYELVSGPASRAVQAGPASWPFAELIYAKGEGGQTDQQDVYYAWRYSGAWTTARTNQRGFERIPGMFKVQVARQVKTAELDLLDVGNPCQAFLAHLMPEIDRRIAGPAAGPQAP